MGGNNKRPSQLEISWGEGGGDKVAKKHSGPSNGGWMTNGPGRELLPHSSARMQGEKSWLGRRLGFETGSVMSQSALFREVGAFLHTNGDHTLYPWGNFSYQILPVNKPLAILQHENSTFYREWDTKGGQERKSTWEGVADAVNELEQGIKAGDNQDRVAFKMPDLEKVLLEGLGAMLKSRGISLDTTNRINSLQFKGDVYLSIRFLPDESGNISNKGMVVLLVQGGKNSLSMIFAREFEVSMNAVTVKRDSEGRIVNASIPEVSWGDRYGVLFNLNRDVQYWAYKGGQIIRVGSGAEDGDWVQTQAGFQNVHRKEEKKRVKRKLQMYGVM